MDQLSDILKEAIRAKGVSQSKVAELTEIERKTFNSYVNGRTEPDLITLRKIIKALGIEKEIIEFLLEQNVPEIKTTDKNMNGNASNVESKYVALLEKTLSEKEADIKTYRSAIEKISTVDVKVATLNSTVHELQGKWKDYEPMILGLREFVTGEIASLKRISHEEASAALSIKVAEQKKKVEQSHTQKG